MPDPLKFKKQSDFMQACVPMHMQDKGVPQDAAVAACLNMWEHRNDSKTNEQVMKSEGDGKHPSSHYLVVEDPKHPSTWHLRVRNASGELDHILMGQAASALGLGENAGKSAHGNPYEGPGKQAAIAKLRRFYEEEKLPLPRDKGKKSKSNRSILFMNQFHTVEYDGHEYFVVPGVPAREQVMNTYLVPSDEIARSVVGWNGVPVTIQHPKQNGGSAKVPSPDVAVIGRFYNAVWDAQHNRMTGEYWIDKNEAAKYVEGQAILDAIQNDQMLETSTGYFADDEMSPGEFGGRSYKTVHRNLMPDHIAILTTAPGACSVKDGCGVNRNAGMVHNCAESDCDCPFKISDNEAEQPKPVPEYQDGHLPTQMLIGYSYSKGSRTAEQLDQMRAHIQKNGITKPVMIMSMEDGNIRIVDGNHRVAMADELGIDQVPVNVFDEELQQVDPEILYRNWLHTEDQNYLNEDKTTLFKSIWDEIVKRFPQLKNNEMSLDQKTQAIRDQFHKTFSTGKPQMDMPSESWIREVFSNFVIAEKDGDLYKVNYSKTGDQAVFDDPSKWQKVEVDYKPVNAISMNARIKNSVHLREGNLFNPSALKNFIYTKESNMKFDEFQKALAEKGIKVNVKAEGDDEVDFTIEETQQETKKPAMNADQASALQGLSDKFTPEVIANLGKIPELMTFMNNENARVEAEKQAMIASIKTNAANQFSDEELAKMDYSMLLKLNAMNGVNYAGMGGGYQQPLFDNEEVLVTTPTLTNLVARKQED